MAIKRVTMQDIADACGLSRNTVSKVYNGRGSVPGTTRALVLAKAQELGYYQLPAETADPGRPSGKHIAILTQHKLLQHNFGALFLTSFTDHLSRAGYTIKIFEISCKEIREKRLPQPLKLADTSGILGIELFDRDYLDMICSWNKPTVFVDAFVRANQSLMNCDFISMENTASEMVLVRQIIQAGASRIGFVGDKEHCNSFYERWVGYTLALREAGLTPDPALCILAEDSDLYGDPDWLAEQLSQMPAVPDAFVCANDYLAIHLLSALKKSGLSIPGDVMVAGFDGSYDADLCDPPLTTVKIPSKEIGRLAAVLLTERIQSPNAPYRWTTVKTMPIQRGSTRS